MRTLAGAVHEKYDDTGEDGGANDSFIQVFIPKSGPHVGSKDSGKAHLPQRLTLDNLQISSAGDGKEIIELCGHVSELDLTKNVITDWKEVFCILEHVPHLHFLNLTMNPLDDDTWDCGLQKQFPNLKDIVLNSTGVSWSLVAKLLSCFPNLTELHVSLNKYKMVDFPAEFVHKSLIKLFVNKSEIENWTEISKLGVAFPCLQTLNIIDNGICELSPESEFQEFQALTDLNISKCQIGSWEEVDKFGHFPALINLRITDLPLVKDWEAKERRQHLVARLPSIKQLNGSTITETERDEAERAFLRYFMDSEDRPARYAELEKIHGKLDPLANVKFERAVYINLLVKFEEKEELMDIYVNQTPGDLKKLLRNFTGLPVAKMQVYYVEMFEGKIKDYVELKSLSRKLLSYNMNLGDEIHVHRKNC
ncbi:tubulin-specific chaperone cofactor E-like protein [Mercenaria mercenaria]|uniref:tubulin-specific chaperone cofactor E-like protein n=1 Tax=Mercenaria mercenaria TaxID=6596 RepID=UPI00234E8F4B|nr:tubulin-specific chaperone cofactor E-like protein [Mercenaria mercenaria]